MTKSLFSTLLSLIALSQPLTDYAAVIYTDVNPDANATLIPGPPSVSGFQVIDFNNDGEEEYNFRWDAFDDTNWFLHVTFAGDNQINLKGTAENEFGARYITAMNTDDIIGTSGNWGSSLPEPLIGDGEDNNFKGLGERYIGVKFKLGANTHYGWILVGLDNSLKFTVKEYAYESIPGVSIKAGDKTGGTTSLRNVASKIDKIKVSPNPTRDILQLNYSGSQINSVQVRDVTGREVASFAPVKNEEQMNVSALVPGIYILSVFDKTGLLSTTKFIKQ